MGRGSGKLILAAGAGQTIRPAFSRHTCLASANGEIQVFKPQAPATHCASCGRPLSTGNRFTCKKKHLHRVGEETTNADATVCKNCWEGSHKNGRHTEAAQVRKHGNGSQ